MELKVLSYNIQHCENFLTKRIDFDTLAQVIQKTNADIIGLNEVRGKGSDKDYLNQTSILAEKLGFYGYFAKAIYFDDNPYGNAILSRFPILSCETIGIPDPNPRKYSGYYETRCLLKATIDIDNGLDVFVTHFGLNPDEHQNAVDTILNNLTERCILMGDFNVFPDNEVINPIRSMMTDTADCNNDNMLSFPSDNPDRKIDYMFVKGNIKPLTAEIQETLVSDHRPYFATIEI